MEKKIELVKEFSTSKMQPVYYIYVNNLASKVFFDYKEAKKYFDDFKRNINNIDKKEILETYEY
jgi:hypothetical protein